MAKKKNDDFISDISKATGGGVLSSAGIVPYFIDTGNLALNYICSGKFYKGGIPGGRITEVFGPPATSKSLLAYGCLASCQRAKGVAVLLDCERASNADFASAAGHVDPDKLLMYEPVSIEQVESKIINVTKAIRKHYGVEAPILFAWDSIGVTPTEREWKEVELPENPSAADIKRLGGKERPGERARAAGDLLRKINPFLNEQNATLFIINQTRKNVGVMYGPTETSAGGGEALKFYASCRLRTSIGKMISSKTGLPLGIDLKFTNKKNRSFVPGVATEGVQLFFEQGINPIGGLLSVLIAAGRIEGKTNYTVKEPWADGKEITFKAKKEGNAIPLEVLLEAPKMLDFESAEEMREYFSLFDGALKLATGNDIVEKEVSDSDEDPDFISALKHEDEEA